MLMRRLWAYLAPEERAVFAERSDQCAARASTGNLRSMALAAPARLLSRPLSHASPGSGSVRTPRSAPDLPGREAGLRSSGCGSRRCA
jgi:hypothetical protein